MRLETKRVGDDLCIRVFPDQLFVNTHNPVLSANERLAGRALVDLIGQPDYSIDDARNRWSELARQHGVGRSAYIVDALRASSGGEGADHTAFVPHMALLPERFVFRIYKEGALAYEAGGQPIPDTLPLLPAPQEPRPVNRRTAVRRGTPASRRSATPPPDGLFDARSRWVSDLDEAVRQGLAIRIRLRNDDLADARSGGLRFSHVVAVGLRPGGSGGGSAAREQFLRVHRYTEGIRFLEWGTATNNSGASRSAHSDSEESLAASFDFVVRPRPPLPQPARDATAAALFAGAVGLPPSDDTLWRIEGAETEPAGSFRLLSRAVWPATADYVLAELVGEADVGVRRALFEHASAFLRPMGPLAAMRIGSQPYGLLPATRIEAYTQADRTGWKADGRDPEFSEGLHRALAGLRPLWLKRARNWSLVPRVGMSDDVDAELVRALHMSPQSFSYRVRPVVDHRLVGALTQVLRRSHFGPNSPLGAFGGEDRAIAAYLKAFDRASAHMKSLLRTMGLAQRSAPAPVTSLLAWGRGERLEIPLVSPADTADAAPAAGDATAESATLLGELLRRALAAPDWRDGSRLPRASDLIAELEARTAAVPDSATELERALRDLLDTLTCRVDAWFTSLATKRLSQMRTRARTELLWGAYGYVEDLAIPAPDAVRDPGGDGFVHALSLSQATAAAVARSAWATGRDDQGGNPWALELTSARVRRGRELLDGVRQSQELSVLLGYRFERGLHEVGLDRLIAPVRRAFPRAVPDPVEVPAARAEELANQRADRTVCDGRALALAWRVQPQDERVRRSLGAVLRGSNAGSSDRDREALRRILDALADSLDAVGDVLMFEGTAQAVEGNGERAGAALDAAAGLERPPELESIGTHVAGNPVRHRVCVVLPDASGGPGHRAAAEPRLNAWVARLLGPLENIGCKVRVIPGGPPMSVRLQPNTGTVSSQDANDPPMSPLDFLHLCAAVPSGTGDTEIEMRLRRRARRVHPSIAADAVLHIDFDDPPAGPAPAKRLSDAMELGRSILDLLGHSRPLDLHALAHPVDPPAAASMTCADVRAVRDRAMVARGALEAQAAALESGPVGLAAQSALNGCMEFGIEHALTRGSDDSSLAERVVRSAAAARQRLVDAGRTLAELGIALPSELAGSAPAPPGSMDLARRALTDLFGDRFVVLPAIALPTQPAGTRDAFAALDGSTVSPTPSEDRVWLWLQQVAETHPKVRALETVLMGMQAWGTWSGSGTRLDVAQLPRTPGLGWQALSDAELGGPEGRAHGVHCITSVLSAAPAGTFAGLLVDDWTETIPAAEVTTGVSFAFDGPPSQAPQCMLLATPGNFDADVWTAEHLAEIVRDTMDLARARLVDFDALPDEAGFLPGLFFPVGRTLPAAPRLRTTSPRRRPPPEETKDGAHAMNAGSGRSDVV